MNPEPLVEGFRLIVAAGPAYAGVAAVAYVINFAPTPAASTASISTRR